MPAIVVNFDSFSIPLVSQGIDGSANYALWIIDSPKRFSISYEKTNEGAIWIQPLGNAFADASGEKAFNYGGNVIERISHAENVPSGLLGWLNVTPEPPTFADKWWMTYSWEQSALGATAFEDTRPNALHFDTGASMPTTEQDAAGRVWWRFDNNDVFQTTGSLASAMANGIFWIVVYPDTGPNGGFLIGDVAPPSGPPIYTVGGVPAINLVGASDPWAQDLRGSKHLVTCRWNNTTGELWWWIDGVFHSPTLTPAGAKTWTTQPLTLGYNAAYGGESRGLVGQMACVNEFAGPILDADRESVDQQLMAYWGIPQP